MSVDSTCCSRLVDSPTRCIEETLKWTKLLPLDVFHPGCTTCHSPLDCHDSSKRYRNKVLEMVLAIQLAWIHVYCINSVCPLTRFSDSRWKKQRLFLLLWFGLVFFISPNGSFLSLLPVQSVARWPNIVCVSQPRKCCWNSPTKAFLGGRSKIICFKILISYTNHQCFGTCDLLQGK